MAGIAAYQYLQAESGGIAQIHVGHYYLRKCKCRGKVIGSGRCGRRYQQYPFEAMT
jgi:hypothetical protein